VRCAAGRAAVELIERESGRGGDRAGVAKDCASAVSRGCSGPSHESLDSHSIATNRHLTTRARLAVAHAIDRDRLVALLRLRKKFDSAYAEDSPCMRKWYQ